MLQRDGPHPGRFWKSLPAVRGNHNKSTVEPLISLTLLVTPLSCSWQGMSLALSELPSNRKYAVAQEGERSLGNCGTLVLAFIRNTGARQATQAVVPPPLVIWGGTSVL